MKILVTNDDGIDSKSLWALVTELSKIGRVMVAAPDKERSAIGTAVTLRHILRVNRVEPPVPSVEAFSIDGTPSDTVFLALGKLAEDGIDFVVSGINQGFNLGEDVYISGTVGGALQGYLHGKPTIAISTNLRDRRPPRLAARVTAALVNRMSRYSPPPHVFLNVNVPDLPDGEISGIRLARLSGESHIDTVDEGTTDGEKWYWLVRQRSGASNDHLSDIWAIEHGFISVTPLYFSPARRPPAALLNDLCAGLLEEIRQ